MERIYSHYSLDELREMREAINCEIEKRRIALRDERFNAMIEAIRAFKEICPDANVRDCDDYEISYSIHDIADPHNWDFE